MINPLDISSLASNMSDTDIYVLDLTHSKDENLKASSRISTYSSNGMSVSTILSMIEDNNIITNHGHELEVITDLSETPRNNEYHSPVIKPITKLEYSYINMEHINKKRKIMHTLLRLTDDDFEEDKKHGSEVNIGKIVYEEK